MKQITEMFRPVANMDGSFNIPKGVDFLLISASKFHPYVTMRSIRQLEKNVDEGLLDEKDFKQIMKLNTLESYVLDDKITAYVRLYK
jgi:hypothetical protein